MSTVEFSDSEVQAEVTERQLAELRLREKEAQAMAAKRQCPEFREREAHAKKQSQIRQACTPSTIIQAFEVFIRATKEGLRKSGGSGQKYSTEIRKASLSDYRVI